MTPQAGAFAKGVEYILEAVMFENWLRFYFITEKPDAPEAADKLFIAIPEQAMKRIAELHAPLLPLAEALNGKEINFESSRSAVCTYVITEVDGKRIPRNMSDTVFDSSTFQIEMQLFNTWVQAHEDQLDRGFMDFAMWRSLFAGWRASDAVKEWATQLQATVVQSAPPAPDTVQ